MRIASAARNLQDDHVTGPMVVPSLMGRFVHRLPTTLVRLIREHPVISAGIAVSVLVVALMSHDVSRSRLIRPTSLQASHLANGSAAPAVDSGPTTAALGGPTTGPSTAPLPATQSSSSIPLEDSGIRLLGAGAVAWGDYDNDGDLDLIISGRTNNQSMTALYRNDAGTFAHTNAQFVATWNASVAWGDVDLDGDLDLAIAGQTATGPVCRVYQNHGGAFTDLHAATTGAGFASLAWADMDNDGQLDLAVAGSNLVRVYRNRDGIFEPTAASLGGAQFGAVAWSDCDGDGDYDLAVAGEHNTGAKLEAVGRLFRNQGEHEFTEVDADLPSLANASLAWADYDADGDPDLAICGFRPEGAICRVYRNDGADTFTDILAGLTGVGAGALAWGDYDNDGDPDLVVSGFHYIEDESGAGEQVCLTRLYRNEGNDQFTAVDVPLEPVHYGSLAWGDYDNDGDLDLAVSGFDCSYQPITRIYRNNAAVANAPPSPPGNLTSEIVGDAVTFRWTAAHDAETPAAGLLYQLRVGTRPGRDDVHTGMADLTSGWRRTAGPTGAHQGLSWTLRGLTNPPYYWSVQAVDAAYAGSAWAPEAVANWSRVHNATQGTWHPTIQEAIDSANYGDEIVLSPGVYSGPGNWEINPNSELPPEDIREVTIRSVDPSDPRVVAATVIDCAAPPARVPRRAFQFVSGEGTNMVLAGLTIRGARAAAGGGTSADGGAIRCVASSPTIRHCVFDTCASPARGGAIAILGSHTHIAPDIRDCIFVGNRAESGGGAVYLADTHLTFQSCTFQGNSAGDGGAVLVEANTSREIWWRNCAFDANHASQRGGAVCTGPDIATYVQNCTFTNNVAQEGGGLRILSSAGVVLTNCILWANRDAGGTGETAQIRANQNAFVNYSHVQGWTGLMSGLFATGRDPLLVDVDGPDDDPATWQDNRLGLTRFSLCINGADPGLSYDGQTDAAGQPRVYACQADIGAYESAFSWPPADLDSDCHVDASDLEIFVPCSTGAGVPVYEPACMDADLDTDGDVDADDFAIFQRCWSGPDHFSIRTCMD